jgi:hypothetical protein
MDADLRRTGSSTSVAQSADGVVALSTFEVISDNKGYDGANTVSGTRFNFKLEDLAASITVVTREQIEDFAMLDTNDVFLYAASTKGAVTLTDFTVDSNGSVSDNVQLNRTQANRVRGLNSANISLGNFETMGRTPLDPLGLDSIESLDLRMRTLLGANIATVEKRRAATEKAVVTASAIGEARQNLIYIECEEDTHVARIFRWKERDKPQELDTSTIKALSDRAQLGDRAWSAPQRQEASMDEIAA